MEAMSTPGPAVTESTASEACVACPGVSSAGADVNHLGSNEEERQAQLTTPARTASSASTATPPQRRNPGVAVPPLPATAASVRSRSPASLQCPVHVSAGPGALHQNAACSAALFRAASSSLIGGGGGGPFPNSFGGRGRVCSKRGAAQPVVNGDNSAGATRKCNDSGASRGGASTSASSRSPSAKGADSKASSVTFADDAEPASDETDATAALVGRVAFLEGELMRAQRKVFEMSEALGLNRSPSPSLGQNRSPSPCRVRATPQATTQTTHSSNMRSTVGALERQRLSALAGTFSRGESHKRSASSRELWEVGTSRRMSSGRTPSPPRRSVGRPGEPPSRHGAGPLPVVLVGDSDAPSVPSRGIPAGHKRSGESDLTSTAEQHGAGPRQESPRLGIERSAVAKAKSFQKRGVGTGGGHKKVSTPRGASPSSHVHRNGVADSERRHSGAAAEPSWPRRTGSFSPMPPCVATTEDGPRHDVESKAVFVQSQQTQVQQPRTGVQVSTTASMRGLAQDRSVLAQERSVSPIPVRSSMQPFSSFGHGPVCFPPAQTAASSASAAPCFAGASTQTPTAVSLTAAPRPADMSPRSWLVPIARDIAPDCIVARVGSQSPVLWQQPGSMSGGGGNHPNHIRPPLVTPTAEPGHLRTPVVSSPAGIFSATNAMPVTPPVPGVQTPRLGCASAGCHSFMPAQPAVQPPQVSWSPRTSIATPRSVMSVGAGGGSLTVVGAGGALQKPQPSA